MICDQCKSHIRRKKSGREGKTVNCLQFGCDGFNQTGYYCSREDIVDYCFDLLMPRINDDYEKCSFTKNSSYR